MIIFMWIFLAITAGCWIYSWKFFIRLKAAPETGGQSLENPPKISVVIPARNEEHNLIVLLPSINRQTHPPDEIVVIDDDSSDNTAHVAKENGARVVNNPPLPDDWHGKQWACYNGAKAATGDWLLFLDADTQLEPEAVEKLLALSQGKPGTVYSVSPWHGIKKWHEEFSSFFHAVMVIGSNAFTTQGENADEIGLFGQAMFVAKTDYDAIEGHKAVKLDVTDHFVIAQRFAEAGISRRVWLGRGIAGMRMYPIDLKELIAGWSKSFVAGAGATPKSALIGVSVWFSALIMSTISLSFLPLATSAVIYAVATIYLACVIQCHFIFSKIGAFSFLNALFFPIPLIFYQWLFFRSLIRAKRGRKETWKGRDVV